jgi:hypothetical protein
MIPISGACIISVVKLGGAASSGDCAYATSKRQSARMAVKAATSSGLLALTFGQTADLQIGAKKEDERILKSMHVKQFEDRRSLFFFAD